MSYYIFFDESGKIDRTKGNFSYYGAVGCKAEDYNEIDEIAKANDIFRELHFNKFNLTALDDYLLLLNYVLEKVKINVYIVDNRVALETASKIDISIGELRELLYIKIPERLIYGILRKLEGFNSINIFIDECNEYTNFKIEEKLQGQLNAQSVYRNLHCLIKLVKQEQSKGNIMLQITDVLLGIVTFLFEKKYYSLRDVLYSQDEYESLIKNSSLNEMDRQFIMNAYEFKSKSNQYVLMIKSSQTKMNRFQQIFKDIFFYTQASIQKAELIYRLLDSPNKLDLIHEACLYLWNADREKVTEIHIANSIAEFFHFKMSFDNFYKLKILNYYKENIGKEISIEEYEEYIGFGKNSRNIVKRYLEELKLNYK